MEYEIVQIFPLGVDTGQKNPTGYAIKKSGLDKLEGTNIYTDFNEICDVVDQMNEATEIRQFWPAPNDPEVAALVNNPDFQPVEYDEIEIPDLENSDLKFIYPSVALEDTELAIAQGEIDKYGRKLGVDGSPVINWQDSTVVYKTVKEPRGTSLKGRFDAACEQVARARREAVVNG